MASRKKTRKQMERAAHKRARKAQAQEHHAKWAGDRHARRYVVSGGLGIPVKQEKPGSRTRRRQRRNGRGWRVGGR
jgi:hypothetical protein